MDELRQAARKAMESGDYRAALSALEEMTGTDDADYRLWNNTGLVNSKLGRYQEAAGSFDKALKLKDDNPHVWFGKGSALFNLGKYEEAKAAYERVLKLDSDHARAKARLDRCNNKLGKTGGEGDAAAGTAEPCPICNSNMRFWEGNWWCDMCNVYPYLDDGGIQGSAAAQTNNCSRCGGPLRYVEKYGRYWCNTCCRYERKPGTPASGAVSSGVACPTCRGSLRYIAQYGRNWCNICKQYR
jgi:tetratricopeptide (TPR) repeat protein